MYSPVGCAYPGNFVLPVRVSYPMIFPVISMSYISFSFMRFDRIIYPAITNISTHANTLITSRITHTGLFLSIAITPPSCRLSTTIDTLISKSAMPPARSPIPIFLKFQRSSFIFIHIASPIKNIPTIPIKPDFTSSIINSTLSIM